MRFPSHLRRRPGRTALATLALSLVVVACGGGEGGGEATGGGAEPSGGGSSQSVEIRDFAFMPETITVSPGTTVTWENFDSAVHTVKAEGPVFDESDRLAQGDTFRFTFDEPGRYPYICGIHNSMRGTVVVS